MTYDSNFNAITTEEPASGRDRDRRRALVHRRSPTASARVTVDGRSLAGVRASQAGPRALCHRERLRRLRARASRRRRRDDTSAPAATVASLRNGAVYSRRRAPRLLRGSVTADPSGLHSVKLKLTRRRGPKCSATSPGAASASGRCAAGAARSCASAIAPTGPTCCRKRLGRGSYVLEVKAIDGAFNRGTPARVRFRVK